MPSSYLENFSIIKKYVTLNFHNLIVLYQKVHMSMMIFQNQLFLNKKRKLFLFNMVGI